MSNEILMSIETRDRLLDNIRRNVPWVDADDDYTAKTYAGIPVRIVNKDLPHFCDEHKLHDERCSICGKQVL